VSKVPLLKRLRIDLISIPGMYSSSAHEKRVFPPDEGVRPVEPPMKMRYGVAALCVLGAFAISKLVGPELAHQISPVFFVLASLAASWYGGLGPGLVALVVGLSLGDYYFTVPLHTLGPRNGSEWIALVVHATTSGDGLAAIYYLHRSRSRERQIASVVDQLETEIRRRWRAEEELRSANDRLAEGARSLERRVAERTAELQETLASLQSVLYHMAHDLRAPLRTMAGFSQLLIETAPHLEGEARSSADRILDASKRMDRLILDLLTYGRLTHTALPLGQVDLDTLVHEVVELLAIGITERNAEVEVKGSFPPVRANREVLGAAIAELIENAITFVAPGTVPTVCIWAQEDGDVVRLCVRDNGIGIPLEYQDKVFGVFERLRQSEEDRGTGIGLAVVYKSMVRMGGKA